MSNKDLDKYFRCSNCNKSKVTYNRIDCGSSEQEHLDNFKKYKVAAAKNCCGFEKLQVGCYTLLQNSMAYKYILSGNSRFKLKSGVTGSEIYYRVQKREFTGGCKINTGYKNYIFAVYANDCEDDLKYIGAMYFDREAKIFRINEGNTPNSKYFSRESKALTYTINKLFHRVYEINVEIYHNGFCGKCSKQLETRLEQHYGLDFNCLKQVNIPMQISLND